MVLIEGRDPTNQLKSIAVDAAGQLIVSAAATSGDGRIQYENQLTSVGQATPWRPMTADQAIIYYSVLLNGSNVTLRIEWSNDGSTNRGSLDSSDTVVTANGSDFFLILSKFPFIRLRFVAANATNATIDTLVIA